MESWFLADVEGLRDYYGRDFYESALRGNPDVEQVPKRDVCRKLLSATKNMGKGRYHKTQNAPVLLGLIHPQKVRETSRNCRRMFDVVIQGLSSS